MGESVLLLLLIELLYRISHLPVALRHLRILFDGLHDSRLQVACLEHRGEIEVQAAAGAGRVHFLRASRLQPRALWLIFAGRSDPPCRAEPLTPLLLPR